MEQNQRLYYSAFTGGFKQISVCYVVKFSHNARKDGPEKLVIQTLFTQWWGCQLQSESKRPYFHCVRKEVLH